MVVIDTSALMSITLGEETAEACKAVLDAEDTILISAGTLAEALVVAERRGLRRRLETLVAALSPVIEPVTATAAGEVAEAYRSWGKGMHPAGLNFGDCFAYALARREGAPLLFVGDDFSRTDVRPAATRP
ncbi:MAG TPA: type II toxin-antitoxin system VapC family toxin [Azospirillaceae bacterium]|nr:type II toxin-antitoxin system VapC family toxin [Azospirillaceae bacterium]